MAQKTPTSKQLLYAEKFGGTLLEQKLKIVGKKKAEKPCLPPPSSVLNRVKEFLPKLQAANDKLKGVPQEEVDIEQISADYMGPVIEMDLAVVPDEGASSSDEECDESAEEKSSSDEESDKNAEEKDSDAQDDGPSISDLLTPLSNQMKKSRKRQLVQEVLDVEERTQPEEEDGK